MHNMEKFYFESTASLEDLKSTKKRALGKRQSTKKAN